MGQAAMWLVLGLVLSTSMLAGACRDDEPEAPTPTPTIAAPSTTPTAMIATATATPTTAAAPSVEDEVLDAYANYWRTYTEALFELDERHLTTVMTGPRLERARDEIAALKAEGHAVKIIVATDPEVTALGGNEAVIVDMYENSSYLIDPETKEPVSGTGTPNTLTDAITLALIDGVWKVRDVVRQVEPR